MDLGLKGKIALVTGSSRGLGYATAQQLSKEGAIVAVNSRSQEHADEAAHKIQAETGARVIGLAGDVSDAEVPEKLVQAVVDTLGGLDILITNAGGPPPGPFEKFDDAAWYQAIDFNPDEPRPVDPSGFAVPAEV